MPVNTYSMNLNIKCLLEKKEISNKQCVITHPHPCSLSNAKEDPKLSLMGFGISTLDLVLNVVTYKII